jgi:hypothetical protein
LILRGGHAERRDKRKRDAMRFLHGTPENCLNISPHLEEIEK